MKSRANTYVRVLFYVLSTTYSILQIVACGGLHDDKLELIKVILPKVHQDALKMLNLCDCDGEYLKEYDVQRRNAAACDSIAEKLTFKFRPLGFDEIRIHCSESNKGSATEKTLELIHTSQNESLLFLPQGVVRHRDIDNHRVSIKQISKHWLLEKRRKEW